MAKIGYERVDITGMIEVSSADVQRHFAEVRIYAQDTPIAITVYGRPNLVMMSMDLYQKLRKSVSSQDLDHQDSRPSLLSQKDLDLLDSFPGS